MEYPTFNTQKELFDFLVANKSLLVTQKKAQMKCADAIVFQPEILAGKPNVNKDDSGEDVTDMPDGTDKDLLAKLVINTTNLIDSHMDMHLDGLWKKSLKENKMIMHLQEHAMKFDHVISDGTELKAYSKTYSWKELGYDYEGSTEALVFESTIKKDRNEFMFEQYKKGYVKNHSVGMRYISLVMCINDKDYGAEYEAWQKYYPLAVNPEVADDRGYFWVVKEAQVIEGSAVLRGSNYATPTLSVEESKNQPPFGTDKTNKEAETEAVSDTSIGKIDYKFLLTNLKK